jgi:hypothetical protein
MQYTLKEGLCKKNRLQAEREDILHNLPDVTGHKSSGIMQYKTPGEIQLTAGFQFAYAL